MNSSSRKGEVLTVDVGQNGCCTCRHVKLRKHPNPSEIDMEEDTVPSPRSRTVMIRLLVESGCYLFTWM